MKKIALALALFLYSVSVHAQEQTLLGSDDVEHGGYGGLVIKFTAINKEFGVLIGGRGGWIINHVFSIGAAGYGLANDVKAHTTGLFGQEYLDFGYGGLELEYISQSNNMIHYSIHTLIGAGSAGFRYGWNEIGLETDNDRMDINHGEHKTFFVLEPGINVDLNVTSWFRMSAGASYRYAAGLTSNATSNGDISGISGMLTFRFGKF